jgi:hypothetical protein
VNQNTLKQWLTNKYLSTYPTQCSRYVHMHLSI